jgi:hypothetical protein
MVLASVWTSVLLMGQFYMPDHTLPDTKAP